MKLEHYGAFLETRSKPIMAAVAVLMLGAIGGIATVDIDTRFDLFAPMSSRYARGDVLMRAAFGESSQLIVLLPGVEGVHEIRRVTAIAGDISNLKGVSSAIGPIPPGMHEASDGEVAGYVSNYPATGGFSPVVMRDDGSWYLLRIQLEDDADLRKTIRGIKGVMDAEAPGAVISGEPYLETQVFDYILQILLFLPPAAIVLMLGVFRLRIGSFRATMLSMVPTIIGAVLTLGILCWVKGTISVMSVLVPIFVIVLGSADGLHVTSHVMDQLGAGHSNREAILDTLDAVGVPIILTSLTTMAGFLSLLVIGSPAIQEMAITAAAGMLIAGLITWVALPILLLHQKPLPPRRPREGGGLSEAIWKLKGWPSIAIAVLVVAAAIPGALRLKADFSMVDMYKARTEVRKSINTVSKVTGGAFPLTILAGPIDPFDAANAKAVLELQAALHDGGLTTSELSLYSLIESTSRKAFGIKGYPESPAMAGRIARVIESTVPDLYRNLVSENGWVKILLYVESFDTESLDSVARLAAESSAAAGIDLYPTGSVFEIMDMNRLIIPQQLKSMGLALLLVMILTAVSLRSVVLGVKAAIPIAVTLSALYGVMGYSGIDLSVITSIMSGLTIGVGIDYAIHFTSVYRYLKRKGADDPAHAAMSFVATPVLANAIGLSVGFTTMVLSPLQIHTTLSILMWVTMVLGATLSLSLLPTMLESGRRSKRSPL